MMTQTKQVTVVSENWKKLKPKVSKSKTEGSQKEIWFEVDEETLRRSEVEKKAALGEKVSLLDRFAVTSTTKDESGKYVAMDCEFVGVGLDGRQHALARVSLVNYHGHVLLDRYVKPTERVTDYRTFVSGIRPTNLKNALRFVDAQREVAELLNGKTVIGHGLTTDFSVLMLSHPRHLQRDTCKFRKFRAIAEGKTPSLKTLATQILGLQIHDGEHDSVEDARVAMLLYRHHRKEWENELFRQEGKKRKEERRERKRKERQEKEKPSLLLIDNALVKGGGGLVLNVK